MKQDELLDKLPENLRIIVQLTDYRTALLFINNFGGTEYRLPALCSVSESHELAELIGLNNLVKICQYWRNGEKVYIPKPDRYLLDIRDKRIEQELKELGTGADVQAKLAKKYGLTTRWIRELHRKQVIQKQNPNLGRQDRQLDMFANI